MQGPIVVATTAGRIRGVRSNGVDSFLGVPYGEPTGGAARLKAPKPARRWTGIRDAFSFGPSSPQVDPRFDSQGSWASVLELLYPRGGTPLEAGPSGESSLVLNVWAPAGTHHEPLPVMVWFHGGGYAHGTGSEAMFNGAALARSGRAIIVTVNHRLGILGYTPLGHLLGEEYAASGNAGLLDLVLALEWVRDNIAGFGGSPERVTIFGQSGGGAKVATLLGVPSAQGLFQQAIVQSGVMGWVATEEEGHSFTSALLDSFGIEESRADMLLELPLEYLLEGQRRFQRSVTSFRPTLDGDFLREIPFGATVTPLADGIPLMIGSTTHDMALMLTEDPSYASVTEDNLSARLDGFYPGHGEALHAQYRERNPAESAQLLLSRIVTDRSFGLAAGQAADAKSLQSAPVFRYEFAYETTAHGGSLGSCHSLDLPFVFGNVAASPFAGEGADRFAVSEAMGNAWLSFAESGVPTMPDGASWPQYGTESGRVTTIIDAEWSVRPGQNPADVLSTQHGAFWSPNSEPAFAGE